MLAFSEGLTSVGMAFNISIMIAPLFKIGISFWCLAVDSAKEKNCLVFKWHCLMTTLVSGIVLCFGAGVIRLTEQGRFFANATRVGAN
jgi:hypothetical protein